MTSLQQSLVHQFALRVGVNRLPRDGNSELDASCTDGYKLVVLGGGQGMLVRSLDGGLTWERGRLPY